MLVLAFGRYLPDRMAKTCVTSTTFPYPFMGTNTRRGWINNILYNYEVTTIKLKVHTYLYC